MALGPVKPHVKVAAEALAARFGIRTMYGWRPVDPFPDHPSGLAVDFMVSNLPNGRSVGDSLAAYAVQNYAALSVDYIIWYRQSWNSRRKTWVAYHSTPNPHTDHVHITFLKTPGVGAMPDNTGNAGTTTNVGYPGQDQIEALISVFRSASKVFAWANDSRNWLRVGIGALGVAFIVFGLLNFETVGTVARGALKVAKVVNKSGGR